MGKELTDEYKAGYRAGVAAGIRIAEAKQCGVINYPLFVPYKV